jgi:RimJ/RimL family protein N-acetyltransferase
VAPEHWRRGVGRTLLRAAIDELSAEGAGDVTLWVLEGNRVAERFYEAMGFRLDGAEQRRPITGGATERRYRLRLGPSPAPPPRSMCS